MALQVVRSRRSSFDFWAAELFSSAKHGRARHPNIDTVYRRICCRKQEMSEEVMLGENTEARN